MRVLALCLSALLALGIAGADAPDSEAPPNILVIVADDTGHGDVGFSAGPGCDIHTPHTDALAAAGIRLGRHYVQPVCSPTRTSLLTGRYPIRYGLLHHVYNNDDAFALYLNETLLPQHMKALGYDTAMVGKSHLGMSHWGNAPINRGFDDAFVMLGGEEDYYTHTASANGMSGRDLRNGTEPDSSKDGQYSTLFYAAEAVRIIRRHAARQAAKPPAARRPLFMYLSWQANHSPQEVPQSYIDPYNASIADRNRRAFAGMVSAMDEGIGNVTSALNETGMDERLLVVFT